MLLVSPWDDFVIFRIVSVALVETKAKLQKYMEEKLKLVLITKKKKKKLN